jgi:NitT/TauT family transport system permease protein
MTDNITNIPDTLAEDPTSVARLDERAETLEPLQPLEATAGRRGLQRVFEWLAVLLVFVVFIFVWWLFSHNLSPIIFPTPFRVWHDLIGIAKSGYLVANFVVTFQEIILGFILGSVLGIGCGVVLAWSPLLQRVFNPYLVASQAMPKIALAPILIMWFGYGLTSKVVIAALIAFFPLLENTVVGLREVPPAEVRLFASLSANDWQVYTKLRFPNALPYIFAGLRVAMLFATVGAVVGEYVGANVGLGAAVIVAFGTLNTSLVFAILVVLTVMGIVLYWAVSFSERFFRPEERRGRLES